MRKPSSNPFRRRQIDRTYLRAIESGPLWGYDPKPRSRQLTTLGAIVAQHWDAVLEHRRGAGLSLVTSLRAGFSVADASPDIAPLLDEAERLAELLTSDATASGRIELLLVDGRCLQHPDFAQRGIGRLARSILQSLVESAPAVRTVVVTDRSLPPIETGSLPATISQIAGAEVDDLVRPFRVTGGIATLDPAPMTHPSSELDRIAARRIAVVHDYVPLHAPDLYLPEAADQLAYLIRLVRLGGFDQFWCNSGAIAAETVARLGRPSGVVGVLPPPPPMNAADSSKPDKVVEPFFFAPVGADRRKNLPGAVSTLAHRSARGWSGNLVILSHMPDAHRKELNDLATASGFDSDRIIVLSDLTDGEIIWLFEHADVAIIPSFDEGLSLPLLEAVDAGCPVVASDIPPHRELLGAGERLCNPLRPSEFADQIDATLGDRPPALERQRAAIAAARSRRSFDLIVELLLGR